MNAVSISNSYSFKFILKNIIITIVITIFCKKNNPKDYSVSIKGKTDPKLRTVSNEYAADILGGLVIHHGFKRIVPWQKSLKKDGFLKIISVILWFLKLQGGIGKTSFLKPLSKKTI